MTNADILNKYNFKFNKQFGQNFIFDSNLLSAIADDANISDKDTVIEIGAGAGTLTKLLSNKAKKVIAFEIDHNLECILNENLSDCVNVEVKLCDFMKYSLSKLEDEIGSSYKVIANLPYYITTPIIMRFIEEATNCLSLTVMVQKEVAERITSLPNTPEYGAITATIACRADCHISRIVNRNMFRPAPNVDSAVLNILINKTKYGNSVTPELIKLIRNSFAMRRKTLLNNISNAYNLPKDIVSNKLNGIGIDSTLRAETLSIENFIVINDAVQDLLNK